MVIYWILTLNEETEFDILLEYILCCIDFGVVILIIFLEILVLIELFNNLHYKKSSSLTNMEMDVTNISITFFTLFGNLLQIQANHNNLIRDF